MQGSLLVALCMLVSQTHANVDIGLPSSTDGRYLFIEDTAKLSMDVDAGRTGVDNCRNCVDFADATLADLVNIIVSKLFLFCLFVLRFSLNIVYSTNIHIIRGLSGK